MPPHSAGITISVERVRVLRDCGLICDLCKGLIREPCLLPCGHSYCRACVKPVVEDYKRRKCPACSCPCATDDLRPCPALANVLAAFDAILQAAPESPTPPPPQRDADGFVLPMLPPPSASAPPRSTVNNTPPLSPVLPPPAKRARSAPGRVLSLDDTGPSSEADAPVEGIRPEGQEEEEEEEDEAILLAGHEEHAVLGGARWPLESSEVKVMESPPPQEAGEDNSTAAPSLGDAGEEGSPLLVKLEPASQAETQTLETTIATDKQGDVQECIPTGAPEAVPEPAEPAPTDPAPADPTPADPTPADPTPADPTPADPAPAEPTPAEPTPIEATPCTAVDPRAVVEALPLRYEPFPLNEKSDMDLPISMLRARCESQRSCDSRLAQCLDRIAAADARIEAMAPSLQKWGIGYDTGVDGLRMLWRKAGWVEAVPAAMIVVLVAALAEPPAPPAPAPPPPAPTDVGELTTGAPIAVAASGLPPDQKELSMRVCNALRVRFVVDRDRQSLVLHRRVTHLVTLDPAPRTLRYCCALLRGRWIVGSSWIRAARSAGGLVPEHPHEASGDTGKPASRAPAIGRAALAARQRGEDTFEWDGRVLPSRGPLQGATAEAFGDFESPSAEELRQLISLAGAEGERAVAGRQHYVFCGTKANVGEAKGTGGQAMHFRRLLDAICSWECPQAQRGV